MRKSILAEMNRQSAHQEPSEPSSEVQMRRAERADSSFWRVRDDALWNPFEVMSFLFWIVFGFGFLQGRSNYVFVVELFLPVILTALTVLFAQAVLRRRAGEPGVLRVLRDRLG